MQKRGGYRNTILRHVVPPRLCALLLLLAMAGCGTPPPFHHPYASGYYSSDIIQCAPYARETSGIMLYGDAGGWWSEAPSRHYRRGHRPEPGAVLVLKRTSRMTSGHVAVVRSVINARTITVTQSNWGSDRHSRHIVYDSMRVEDISAKGDWTRVRFWNDEKNVYGFPYAAYGFIYSRTR